MGTLRHGGAFTICILVLFTQVIAHAAEFYVSPSGHKTWAGSITRPWDLQTALHHPRALHPGDTLWLREGIYQKNNRATKFTSTLQGTPEQPIIVRQYPGERAVIDGSLLQDKGGWVNYWGFEILNSHPNRLTDEPGPFPRAFWVPDGVGKQTDLAVSGFDLRAPNVKLINLAVHDCIGGGIGISAQAVNAEVYGTLCFYNGWQGGDRGHGHGIYAQSVDPGRMRIVDCIIEGNYAIGIQASGTTGVVDNFHLEGNVLFFNGILSRHHQANLLLGPYSGAAKNPRLIRNFIYDTNPSGSDSNIGYEGGTVNAVVQGNYFQTPVRFSVKSENLTVTSNTFLAETTSLDRRHYSENTYAATPPSTNVVEVRPNRYEPGRAHILIYNWEKQRVIPVDLSGVMAVGSEFEIRNAQDFLGAPIHTGTYSGGSVELPMTGLKVAKPLTSAAPISTAPEFNVFVVLSRPKSITQSEPPSIPSK